MDGMDAPIIDLEFPSLVWLLPLKFDQARPPRPQERSRSPAKQREATIEDVSDT